MSEESLWIVEIKVNNEWYMSSAHMNEEYAIINMKTKANLGFESRVMYDGVEKHHQEVNKK